MKGAFLLAINASLDDEVRGALERQGALSSPAGDVCQLTDELGRFFTAFLKLDPARADDWQAEPLVVKAGNPPPDMAATSACWIECRWDEMFVRVVEQIASELSTEAWVLDGNDGLWPAREINLEQLQL